MKLKKYIIFVLLFVFLFSTPAFAENQAEVTNGILGEEQEELISILPEESRELFVDEKGDVSLDSLSEIDVSALISRLWEEFLSKFQSPFKALISVTAVIIICSIATSLKKDNDTSGKSDLFTLVADLSIILILLFPLMNLIESVINIISVAGEFVVAFIPIFTGIMLAGGETAKAAGYQITALSAAECVTAIAENFIMPLLSVSTSLSIASATSDTLNLAKVSEGIKKISVTLLTALATVYSGVITVQEIAGNVTDTAISKTAKFVFASSVPAVGTAVSGALTSVQSSIKAVRGCVGVVGVIAPIIILLPTLMSVFCWQISLKAGATVAELFALKRVPELLNSISSVIGLLMSILILLGMILIVTAGVVVAIGGM